MGMKLSLQQLETLAFDEAKREVDRQEDALLDDITRRLQQQTEREPEHTPRRRLT